MSVHASPISAITKKAESSHILALDGIRGLAILMVLAHHLVYINSGPRAPVYIWTRALRDSLWCGVDVFFALCRVGIELPILRKSISASEDAFRIPYSAHNS